MTGFYYSQYKNQPNITLTRLSVTTTIASPLVPVPSLLERPVDLLHIINIFIIYIIYK